MAAAAHIIELTHWKFTPLLSCRRARPRYAGRVPLELFRIAVPVDLSPDHPDYWEIGDEAWLLLWLWAPDHAGAVASAARLVEELPWSEKRESPPLTLRLEMLAAQPGLESCEHSARCVGLAMFLMGVPPGAD